MYCVLRVNFVCILTSEKRKWMDAGCDILKHTVSTKGLTVWRECCTVDRF